MNIYEIDDALLALIDEETGEIKDFDAFEALKMERDAKIENTALWYKNLTAEAKAIREEEKALAERRRACENKAERLLKHLSDTLNGEKFKTSKAAITYRKSTAVEIADGFTEWARENADELLTYKEPEPNKAAIKNALKSGEKVKFAALAERQNISVK